MAAVLTLDSTLSGAESCSFSGSAEPLEVPADEGDTADRGGFAGSGMKGYFGHAGAGDPSRLGPAADRLSRPVALSKFEDGTGPVGEATLRASPVFRAPMFALGFEVSERSLISLARPDNGDCP
jgi:hypothetical protein